MTREELKELWQARPEYLNEDQEGHEDFNKGWNACMSEWSKIILNATTIDAEPVRRGYWVTTWNRYDKDGYIIQTRGKCSCCNQYSEVLDYCGNCGAKMDEVDE